MSRPTRYDDMVYVKWELPPSHEDSGWCRNYTIATLPRHIAESHLGDQHVSIFAEEPQQSTEGRGQGSSSVVSGNSGFVSEPDASALESQDEHISASILRRLIKDGALKRLSCWCEDSLTETEREYLRRAL